MKLQVENHDITVTISKTYEDVTISEWYEMFASCLIGITFTQEQINNYIMNKAGQLSEDVIVPSFNNCKS